MNIGKLSSILNTIRDTSIKTAIIEVRDNDKVMIRAIDDDSMIAIYHEMSNGDMLNKTVGIKDINSFTDKLTLFDLDEVEVNEANTDQYTKAVNIKQGRRKIFYGFNNPEKLKMPAGLVQDTITTVITLSSERTKELMKSFKTFKPETFNIASNTDGIMISFADKNEASFEDVLTENSTGNWNHNWKRNKFVTLMNNVIGSDEEDITISISSKGIIYFDINDVVVMLTPTVV